MILKLQGHRINLNNVTYYNPKVMTVEGAAREGILFRFTSGEQRFFFYDSKEIRDDVLDELDGYADDFGDLSEYDHDETEA